jgi:lipid-binding SYLF domain-containing protein
MNSRLLIAAVVAAPLLTASRPATPAAAGPDPKKCQEAVAAMTKKDEGINKFFKGAVGYAIFPSIGKGAIGIGGATGTGCVYAGGAQIGNARLSQVTVGLQLGGQSYSELIFFQTAKTLDGFKNSDFSFDAQVSAVAVTAGASANAAYRNGVAVFTMAKGGLMYEASVGGQKFSYESLADAQKDKDKDKD